MFYEQLDILCRKNNTSPTEFVKNILQLSTSKVTAWKNGSIPKYGILEDIASYFNVSVGYLFDGDYVNSNDSDITELINNYNMVDNDAKSLIRERAAALAELQAAKKQTVKTPLKQHLKQSETKAEYIYLPYPDSPASAGTGEYLDSDTVEELQVPATNLTRQADYALSVHGDSMEPSYHDGDIVLVSKSDALSIGDIGIFVVNGEGYIKEYGGDRLISINNKYSDIIFNENDRCECQGKVIGKL